MPLQIGALKKRCPENAEQIHRIPTPNCDPKKAAWQLY